MSQQTNLPQEKKSIEVETVLQIGASIAQTVGVFVFSPDFLSMDNKGNISLAVNPVLIISIALSFLVLYLGASFNRPKNAKYWLIVCIVSLIGLAYSSYTFDGHITTKTMLLSTGDSNSLRLVKGNHFLPKVQECANMLKTPDGVVSDFEIIQNCGDIKGRDGIDAIWPRNEIEGNRKILIRDYLISFLLGGIFLLSGIQAIKCKRNKK